MSQTKVPRPQAPSSLAGQLLRHVRWFGVGVALGLAPFLGALPIPGFSALLEMYPQFMRGWLIPLSGMLMGVVAVVIEFLGTKVPRAASLQKGFAIGLAIWGVAFLALLFLYPFWVTRVEIGDGTRTAAFVTGADVVPLKAPESLCTCPAGQSAAQCVGDISLTQKNVRECFGSRVTLATQVLALLYLLLTGTFVFIVGFLLLLQRVTSTKPRIARAAK